MGMLMLRTFLSIMVIGVVMAFHDSLWTYSFIPVLCGVAMVALGLLLEREDFE
jgi:hypothetical protein